MRKQFHYIHQLIGLIAIVAALAVSVTAMAETAQEKKVREMAEMQKMLNAEVMAKPFSVEEMSKIDSYVAEAMKKNLIPQPYKGTQTWKKGMTCSHLRGYRARRDCRFYHQYYGYYYGF